MTQAREYITFLIDFCLAEDVPTKAPLMELADDIERGIYSCLCQKKCCVCQKKAELHHCQSIGAGYNRREKPQVGALVMPLCREHHMEWHRTSGKGFNELYHVVPVRMDKHIAKVYGLTEAAQQEGEYGQSA